MSDDFPTLARQAAAASDRAPADQDAALLAAEMFLRAGDFTHAVRYARRAVAIDPAGARGLRVLSGMLDAAGARAEAVEAARSAVNADKDNPEPRLHLAGLLAMERQWREAATHLLAYADCQPEDANGWRLLASVLRQSGRLHEAIGAAEHALLLTDSVDDRLELVSLLSAAGRYEEARAHLPDVSEDARVWRARAELHAVLGELPQALTAAERAVALAPDDRANQAALAHIAGICAVPLAAEPITNDGPAPAPAPVTVTVTVSTDHASASSPRSPGGAVEPRRSTLAEDLGIRWRVIYAIMLRDIRTRFGHTRLGYLWAMLEPIGHLGTLGVVFSALNHAPPPVGDNLFLFYITGLVPFLMFGHVALHVMQAADDGNAMLRLPVIKRVDVMLAQGLRQFATEICVGIIIFTTAGLLGERGVPADILTTMAAVTVLALLAIGIGAINMTISAYIHSYETFFAAVLRLLYFGSGIYYSPISMPDWLRAWLELNPILQGIEFFRAGFFPQYEPHWLNVPYLLAWTIGAIGIGFALERATRAHTTVHA